jgi:hypothetical protein
VEDVISYYYQGGSNLESEFWKASVEKAASRLERRPQFRDYLKSLAQLRKKGVMHTGAPYAFSPHTWQVVDSQLGYDSFAAEPDV